MTLNGGAGNIYNKALTVQMNEIRNGFELFIHPSNYLQLLPQTDFGYENFVTPYCNIYNFQFNDSKIYSFKIIQFYLQVLKMIQSWSQLVAST